MISLLRADDRLIHGQVVTRWAKEMPCEGLIAVNDAAAGVDLLKRSFQSAAPGKKVFVWTMQDWETKKDRVLASRDRYFVITKDIQDMKRILVDHPFEAGTRTVVIGPCSVKENAVILGNNQSVTPEEADMLDRIAATGYDIVFALVPDAGIGHWTELRKKVQL